MRLQSKLMIMYLILVLLVALSGVINTRTHQHVTDNYDRLMDADVPGLMALGQLKGAALKRLEVAISYAFLHYRAGDRQLESKAGDPSAEITQIARDAPKDPAAFRETRSNLHKRLAEYESLPHNTKTQADLKRLWELEGRLHEAGLNVIHVGSTGTYSELLQTKEVLKAIEDEWLTLVDRIMADKLKEFTSSRDHVRRGAMWMSQLNVVLLGMSLGALLLLGSLLAKVVVDLAT